MTQEGEIVCKPTHWFFWRALLMLLMFGFFGLYFLYDWKYGYPKKNVIVAHYRAFEEAEKAWKSGEQKANWGEYVSNQTIPFEDDQSIYPEGTDFSQKWPEIIADEETMESQGIAGLWRKHSEERQWPDKVNVTEDRKPADKIKEQIYSAGICGILTAIALFFLIRTRSREMTVSNEGFTPAGSKLIPFAKMKVIDKRKWETKGLAYITYEDDSGSDKKAKVDGMVYGQFKEEEGAPAEALFQRILANFNGELIEFVPDEDEDEEEEAASEESKS